jgi:hypothetical protein
MRYLTAALAAVMCSAALAETTIYYDDGTTYTLLNGEEVFVSYNDMFTKQEFLNNGQILFSPRHPNRKRDYVETTDPADGLTPGGAEWCAVYEPFKDGYTFSDAIWSKNCNGG